MARIAIPILGVFAHPRRIIQIDERRLTYLDAKRAHILFAVGEAIVGNDFNQKAPDFVYIVDDYLAYQRRESREALAQGLLITENWVVSLVFARRPRGFSHLSIEDRRRVLARLAVSDVQLLRNLYAAFVNISASVFYSHQATWAEVGYDGVSVDHPELLATPRWRPGDPRPVEP